MNSARNCSSNSRTPSRSCSKAPVALPDGEQSVWFARRLLRWFERHGRKDLPWQEQPSPYEVWISEIMLQQTQVATVIPYYQRFMARFPDAAALASAPLDEVLRHWAGLGYYARARNLHRAAQTICRQHHGRLPLSLEELQALPGIGRSTAGAILALAAGQRQPILDGNVKRVLCRFHAVAGWPGRNAVSRRLWELAERHTPQRRVAAYTQAIMDLGALLCTRSRPNCSACPLAPRCQARIADAVQKYPQPRPRKTLPEKHTTMIILENASGQILLEKRPPAGIWGGLWSLPECPHPQQERAAVQDWCQRHLGCAVEIQKAAPGLRHSFTHFHLHITPLHARLAAMGGSVMEGGRHVWYNVAQLQEQALATPVKRILQRLQTTENC